MRSRYEDLRNPRGLARLRVRMFAHPSGRLGRLGTRMMLRLSHPGYEWVTELLEPGPEDVFLDVGCGPGGLLEEAGKSAGTVIGVDASADMAELARAKSGAEVHVGLADRIPLPDAHVTIACAMHTIHFWESIPDGLAEMARVLEPGGRAAIVVRSLDLDAKPWEPARNGLDGHQLAELEAAMVVAGFADVTRHEAHPGAEALVALVGTRGAG